MSRVMHDCASHFSVYAATIHSPQIISSVQYSLLGRVGCAPVLERAGLVEHELDAVLDPKHAPQQPAPRLLWYLALIAVARHAARVPQSAPAAHVRGSGAVGRLRDSHAKQHARDIGDCTTE